MNIFLDPLLPGIQFISDPHFLRIPIPPFYCFTPNERLNMQNKYPGASQEGIDLLNRMLQFNPYFRISVDEALAHPFFNRVRKPHKERESDIQVVLEFETETLDRTRLREHFVSIILDFETEKEAKAAAKLAQQQAAQAG